MAWAGCAPLKNSTIHLTVASGCHISAGVVTTTSTAHCYDNADRLTSTTVTNPVPGANPVAGTNLSTTGTTPTLAYDAHGNTTTLANETLGYDGSDRHLTTVTTGATPASVTYVRDVTDRIVAQTIGGTTVRFGFTGSGDSPDFTMNRSNAVTERTLSLPGGVLVSIRASTEVPSQVCLHPHLHGDVAVTTEQNGVRQRCVASYDPFGQSIDSATGNIGTVAAATASPNDTTTSGSYDWVGSNQKLFQHAGDLGTIEMGARQYIAALGRFLQVDLVAGGNENAYNYPNDPIAHYDLNGLFDACMCGTPNGEVGGLTGSQGYGAMRGAMSDGFGGGGGGPGRLSGPGPKGGRIICCRFRESCAHGLGIPGRLPEGIQGGGFTRRRCELENAASHRTQAKQRARHFCRESAVEELY